MRDVRFDRRYASALHSEQVRLNAEQYAREVESKELILQAILACIVEILRIYADEVKAKLPRSKIDEIFSQFSMPDKQQKLWLAVHSHLCELQDSSSIVSEEISVYATQLIAEGLMHAISSELTDTVNEQKILEMARLADNLDCFREFVQEILKYFKDRPQHKDGYADKLNQWPTEINEYIEDYVRDRLDMISDALCEVEAKIKYPSDLWTHFHGNLHLARPITARLSLLAALDPLKAVLAIEKFPAVEIKRCALWYLHIFEDRALLLSSIEAAPRMFRDDKWLPKSSLLLLLADGIIEHAKQLHAAMTAPGWFSPSPNSDELRMVTQEELPNWFNTAFSTLCTRSKKDGIPMALELGIELVRRNQNSELNKQEPAWNANASALDILSNILKQQEVDPLSLKTRFGEQYASQRIGSDHSLLPVLIFSIYLINDDANKQANQIELWNWYLELLKMSEHGILNDVSPYEHNRFAAKILSNLLVDVSNLEEEHDLQLVWDRAWLHLYSQRQQFRFMPLEHDLLKPSLHVLRIGHTCLQYLATEKLPTLGKNIWMHLYSAARNLALSELWSHPPLLHLIREWALLFAYLPAIFYEDWFLILKENDKDLQVMPKLTLLVSVYLTLNGISRSQIEAQLQLIGIDLDNLISCTQEWSDLVGHQRDIEGWPIQNLFKQLKKGS